MYVWLVAFVVVVIKCVTMVTRPALHDGRKLHYCEKFIQSEYFPKYHYGYGKLQDIAVKIFMPWGKTSAASGYDNFCPDYHFAYNMAISWTICPNVCWFLVMLMHFQWFFKCRCKILLFWKFCEILLQKIEVGFYNICLSQHTKHRKDITTGMGLIIQRFLYNVYVKNICRMT